jgi:hypothetical protein
MGENRLDKVELFWLVLQNALALSLLLNIALFPINFLVRHLVGRNDPITYLRGLACMQCASYIE